MARGEVVIPIGSASPLSTYLKHFYPTLPFKKDSRWLASIIDMALVAQNNRAPLQLQRFFFLISFLGFWEL